MSDRDPKMELVFPLFEEGDRLRINGRWSAVWTRPGVKGEMVLPFTRGVWHIPPLAEKIGIEVEVSAKVAQKALDEHPKYRMQLKSGLKEVDTPAEASRFRDWYSARFEQEVEIEEVYEYR